MGYQSEAELERQLIGWLTSVHANYEKLSHLCTSVHKHRGVVYRDNRLPYAFGY